MTQTIESTPRLNEDAAAEVLAANLRVLRGCIGADGTPDNPGDQLVEILREELDAALRSIGIDTNAGDDADMPISLLIADCCTFMAKALFVSMTESPQRAVDGITPLLDDLRTQVKSRASAST
jgi:hypothetical protein